MFRKNLAREWFNFAKRNGFKPSRPIKAKAKAPDAAKEVQNLEICHGLPPSLDATERNATPAPKSASWHGWHAYV
jgi:hypothetical protein